MGRETMARFVALVGCESERTDADEIRSAMLLA